MTAHYSGQPVVEESFASAVAVTPTDNTALPDGITRALWVGTAGNLAVKMAQDAAPVTLNAVSAGTLLALAVAEVEATNTTAANIIALY